MKHSICVKRKYKLSALVVLHTREDVLPHTEVCFENCAEMLSVQDRILITTAVTNLQLVIISCI